MFPPLSWWFAYHGYPLEVLSGLSFVEACPIPATMVLSVLQRVADGSANARIDEDGHSFVIHADGWEIDCEVDGAYVDIYRCRAPDGAVATWEDWDCLVAPDELLSQQEHKAIIRKMKPELFDNPYRTVHSPKLGEYLDVYSGGSVFVENVEHRLVNGSYRQTVNLEDGRSMDGAEWADLIIAGRYWYIGGLP